MTLHETAERIYQESQSHLAKIGFYMYTTYGYPFELFLEEIGYRDMTPYEVVRFVASFNKINPGGLQKPKK